MRKILLLSFLLSGCGYWPPWDKPKKAPVASDQITDAQVAQLKAIRSSTIKWADTCVNGITCLNGGDRDSALFAGIACLAGETMQCDAVRMSQGPDGKLWRAPDQIGSTTGNSSSRDMLLSGLAYIVATKDTAFATNLVNYIHAHNNTLCQDSTTNACDVGMPTYSEVWGTMAKIWEYIGLTPDSTMREGTFGESEILAGESMFSPSGYTQHLPMVEMWIRQYIGGWDTTLANAAAGVASSQNFNPFFEYVAHGATQTAADLAITECGGPEPAVRQYWTWQEDDSLQRWTSRNGWDCISLIDLLTKGR